MASNGYTESMTADGQTAWLTFVGPIVLKLTGGFGGGTAKLEERDTLGATVDVYLGSFVGVTHKIFDYPENSVNELRVDLAVASGSSRTVTIQGKTL